MGERVSYAAILHDAAGELTLRRDEHQWTDEARRSLTTSAAALRALALLVERAETEASIEHRWSDDSRAEPLRIVAALAAGYEADV
jgi:hypothetical protein